MTVFEKLRIWGIKGAVDFLIARCREKRIEGSFGVMRGLIHVHSQKWV